MGKRLHILSLWAINGELDQTRLIRQLEEMKAYGFDGTVFHPRYYPGVPLYMGEGYLKILSEVILRTKELGLEFWIYDENGWPSGSADGKVLEHFPDRFCQWLVKKNGRIKLESRKNFNTLDREQMQYFIQVTYDAYRLGLKQEAFSYVTGFFSDEVGFLDGHGATAERGIPWCEEAITRMEKIFGKGNMKPEMLFEKGAGYQRYRAAYWQILADILSESFYEAINGWCEKYGKRYTAHLKGEENIFFQIPYSGSCFSNLKKVNLPMVDALERYPGNHYYPKIVSSLSRQFGDGECMAESLGGSGWGLSPGDLERYVDWLAECGINRFAFHLWQYDKNSASVRDWPPDIPGGMNWREAVPALLSELRKKWDSMFVSQDNPCLLIAPVRGCMAEYHPEEVAGINEHNGDGTPDTESGRISQEFSDFVERMYLAGMKYDVTDERMVEEYGIWKNGKLHLGEAAYTCVVAGHGCAWERVDSNQAGIYQAEDFGWKVTDVSKIRNQIPLEWENCHARVIWKNLSKMEVSACRVRLQDEVDSLYINGHQMERVCEADGIVYRLPEEWVDECGAEGTGGEFDFYYIPEAQGERNPFAFLEGHFLVNNEQPYREKDGRQLYAEGDFYIVPVPEAVGIDCQDLVRAGFPFCRDGIFVGAKCYIGEDGVLKLGNVQADCAQVIINGKDAGYTWGPEWKLDTGLEAGVYEVELKLIPSTYNTYGPHHHIDGDRHLVSPEQYEGKKNFADWPDAPENTWIKGWHLVKFGIF